MTTLHLITTCTQQKRLPPGPGMVLSQVVRPGQDQTVASLAHDWMEGAALATLQQSLPAEELYQGAHWSTARQAARDYGAHLHILSAGLGLLQAQDAIPGYQATFSPRHNDSIPTVVEGGASHHWWRHLSYHRLPGQAAPRSLEALMQANSQDRFVIVASLPYVCAVAEDLTKGLRTLPAPNSQCLIVTAGEPVPAILAPYVLRSRQTMQAWLGGSMMTLNIRLGRQVLAQARTYQNLSTIRSQIEAYSSQLTTAQPRRQGRKSSEAEVMDFILELRRKQPEISATRALRALRDSGRAFEEKRFRRLFASALQTAIS